MKVIKEKFPSYCLISCLSLVSLATGCSSVDKLALQPIHNDPKNEDEFVKVDLIHILDPREAKTDSIEVAFQQFYLDEKATEDADQRAGYLMQRRNAVQSRLIAASNVECGRYRSRLLRVQSGVDFGLGTLTTTLAAAGAIVTGGSSPTLSGSAAVVNSARASFNENYFRQLAMEQITRAIQANREEFLSEIAERRNLPIAEYTVEYAVGDAMQYHFKCSLISGLEYTSDAIANARDPGINRTMRTLGNSGLETAVKLDPKKAKRINSPFQSISTDEPVSRQEEVTVEPKGAKTQIERSMKISQVKRLQRALCLNDTTPGKNRQADGVFGVNTRAEIESFQKLNGSQLPPEGIGFLIPSTVERITAEGDCDAQFKSYFERHALEDESGGEVKNFKNKLVDKLKKHNVNVDLSLDGVKIGPKTRAAIMQLKQIENIGDNDLIDDTLLNKIGRVGI
jgi:peptidoglycan hydrolase-like protein with peptidoglycan-binding domain